MPNIALAALKPHPRNYNRHPAAQIEKIKRSLVRFGQRKPITTWRGMVLTGHGVWMAAQALGWTEIWAEPCPEEWTEAEALAWLAADNELARGADPDDDALAVLVASLGMAGNVTCDMMMPRGTCGSTKVWMQGWNATNNATLDFFVGWHEYEG